MSFEPVQHYLYFIFDPWNWGTNASEQLLAFVGIAGLGWLFKKYVWPKLRPVLRTWMKELHHEAIEEHEEWKAKRG